MGFWDSNFGTPYNQGNAALMGFYKAIYFDFNLTSPYALRPNAKVPVTVTTGLWSSNIINFEVRGSVLEPLRFMGNGWDTVFNKIARNVPTAKNAVWVYDVTGLPEGILKGRVAYESGGEVAQSEEYLKILRLLGGSVAKPLSLVPAVRLGFGPTWGRFGIPDSIQVTLESMYPFTDSDFQRIIDIIIHSYRNVGAPVTASYSWNPSNGALEIRVNENVPVPPQPQQQPAPQNVQSQPREDDRFPYEFYRGLGLIDNENMVVINTFLGPMRVHMTTEGAQEHLLSYQPES